MWNVRIVSCVPGSPIDCAAMMPTARPARRALAAREVHAVAACADARGRLTGERRAHADLLVLPRRLDALGDVFGDELVLAHDDVVGHRVDDRVARDAAADGLRERDRDLVALVDGALVTPIVPQSSVVMTTFCATSVSLRVR
jgi:hypothetical protein